jgi:uncharacterized protein (TIGR00369 family)
MTPGHAEQLKQGVLAMPMAQFLGLRFIAVEAGMAQLELPYREELSFRPGQMQATPIFAAADFAAVVAAGTLLEPGWINATIDCALKIVGPADGDKLVAHGRVVSAGRLLTVSAADVYAVRGERRSLCATALVTARNIELKKA